MAAGGNAGKAMLKKYLGKSSRKLPKE